jgi:hypothetical protein
MSLPTDAEVLVVTDIHGCIGSLTRLLNAAPKGVQLVFGGDLIDRGPNSRAVVEMAMGYNIPTVAANHDDLCLAFYRRKAHCANMYDPGVWLHNGGKETLPNWPVNPERHCSTPAEAQQHNRDQYLGGRVPDDVLDWMESLPAYLYPSTRVDANGRRLLVSHTGYGLNADFGDWFSALWGRHPHGDGPFVRDEKGNEVDDGLWRTVGHSPVREAVITDTFGYIDSGCAYTSNRGEKGHLTGFLWPSKRLIIQPNDESPVKPTFTIQSGGVIT